MIKFWIEINGAIIDPADYAPIATAEVVTAVNVVIGEEMAVIEYSETSRVYDYQNTHFIMITGQVYEEDLPHFKLSLDAFFEGKLNLRREFELKNLKKIYNICIFCVCILFFCFVGSDNYTVEMVPRIDSFFETTTKYVIKKMGYKSNVVVHQLRWWYVTVMTVV